ncbi:Alpha-globin transcription factor CP2 [Folsomia candida]|uniref:Alpha-globin transcription factor CP2 n=1 Tax=Folsomia candida TaxID=158441 RepID=A0A226ENQ2_FOLCA|nr:Alpha-globin transcription factor CP2 [Folsomia candida]
MMDDYRVGYLLASMASPYNGHRNMSSEVRMAPRPAKSACPAWSHGLLPSPIDDPSSCSDNASDNSDKIESYCQSQAQGNGGKNRKRKIVGNGGNPSFVNSGGPMNDGSNQRVQQQQQQQHQQQQQQQKDANNETRNSLTQGLWTDAELAADFDGSLSGLGADLSTSSYDMSEALLALPTIYHQQRAAAAAAASANNNTQQNQSMASGFLKSDSGLTPLASSHVHGGSSVSLPGDFHFDGQQQQQNTCQQNSSTGTSHPLPQETMHLDCERRFQYVLAAATSVATKVNEETLTYLNQCQPYEIKLKKLGELTAYRGVVFRTVVRLCFHDRRLQFSEREQLALWEDAHPNDRILQVDLPLSYGVTLVPPGSEYSSSNSNLISFFWEPLKEVGLYIKVNCISTEFTPKKHGGEKGVPFRLMIETYSHDNIRLHAGACQIKVFKLKISLESLESPPPAIHNQSHQTLSPSYEDHPIVDSPENNSNNSSSGNANGNNGNHGSTQTPSGVASTGPTSFSAHFSPESVRRWLTKNRMATTMLHPVPHEASQAPNVTQFIIPFAYRHLP